MKISCANCEHRIKLYVPPVKEFENIPKDKYVCKVFLQEAREVQYLDGSNGFCEMYQERGDC